MCADFINGAIGWDKKDDSLGWDKKDHSLGYSNLRSIEVSKGFCPKTSLQMTLRMHERIWFMRACYVTSCVLMHGFAVAKGMHKPASR